MWIGTCSAASRSFSFILYGTVDLTGEPSVARLREPDGLGTEVSLCLVC